MTGKSNGDRAVTVDSELRVSLDMESVLAAVHPYFLTVYNDRFGTSYSREDIDGWDWVHTEVEFETFNEIVDNGWETGEINPTAPDLHATVDWLTSQPGITVDIVTARTGVETGMKNWLTDHSISVFDSFIATNQSKAELGYDVFIDDKPGLADELTGDQTQYLISQPHNKSAREHDRVIVVPDVDSAVSHLLKTRVRAESSGNNGK